MDWSNWVYLGTGIALGMICCRIFGRLSNSTHSSTPVTPKEQQIMQQLQQLQLAYQMAWEMSQFKAGFLARTTHELRSPLNGLIGLHQLILSDLCEDPAEEREFIAQAHERALKLLKLIDEILRVARTEHGTNKLDIQPLPLTEVLQEVYQLIYLLAANRNFPLQVLPADPDIYVLADPRWLRQVLVNLVDTAIAQMEEGSIFISSSPAPTSNSVNIWLDIPAHALTGSESIDFIKSIDFVNSEDKHYQIGQENPDLSPGMKLLLNQTLLEVMGGKLEIVSSPNTTKTSEQLTRLQVSIPLLTPEAEFLQSSEKLDEIGCAAP
ncbi:MAG: HAMP domain-containing histidine kinase [Goleter apudmare HA4340-LM2]|nr:HAMP domain-containing histidine kinase [Goleter apudmare HA4340-LM2]